MPFDGSVKLQSPFALPQADRHTLAVLVCKHIKPPISRVINHTLAIKNTPIVVSSFRDRKIDFLYTQIKQIPICYHHLLLL